MKCPKCGADMYQPGGTAIMGACPYCGHIEWHAGLKAAFMDSHKDAKPEPLMPIDEKSDWGR